VEELRGKKEHSLQALYQQQDNQQLPRPTVRQRSQMQEPVSDDYMSAFPDCRCIRAFICDSCRKLPIDFTPAIARLASIPPDNVAASGSSTILLPPPTQEIQVVKPPQRWERYGLLGHHLRNDKHMDKVLDAVDSLPNNPSLPPVHRLTWKTHDERGVFAREFETQLIHNKLVTKDIMVSFDGLAIPVHVERYKEGKVIIKARLSQNPIAAERVQAFKLAIQDRLEAELGLYLPSSETWQTTYVDAGRDVRTTDTRRRTFINESYKDTGMVIHAYNKPIAGQRYLRVEVQFNPHASTQGEFLASLERANTVLLEFCGRV
jgi:hypothetical protein